jgi:hypothetical protein
MITLSHKGKRHVWGMNDYDFAIYAEILWLLVHTPPPAGYMRKPFTPEQTRKIDEIYNRIGYPDNFQMMLNQKTGQ